MIKRWFASLVNRAVLFMVAGIILSALVVVVVSSWVSRSELEAQARQQVSTIADLVANDLDMRLAQRRNTLAQDRKSTRLNSSHSVKSRMPSSA